MPVVFRRSLFFGGQDSAADDLYPSLSQDLRTEIVTRLKLQDDLGLLASWPNSDWSNSYGSATARCREWTAEADPHNRLLQVQLVEYRLDYEWAIELRLGSIGDEVILHEEGSISPSKPEIPFEEMPNLLPFTNRYSCKDEDGMMAGRTYIVSSDRVDAFADFIQSPQRRVPIVLISRTPDSASYLLADTRALARRLRGLAHIIKLEDAQTAQLLVSHQPKHGCYNGAVRVFWPGFKTTDNPELHHLWPPRQFRTVEDISAVSSAIFSVIALESSRIFAKNPDIQLLEDGQSEQESRKRLIQLEKEIGERLRLRLQQQADAGLEELVREYDQVRQERDDLKKDNDDLRAKVSQLEHKIRDLNWHLNSAWQGRQQPESDDRQVAIPAVLLSGRARKQYDSFDHRERAYWDEHILNKLSDRQLRDNQTELVEGPSGTCWVYPRKRTADGRRVIYYGEDEAIYVCELFTGGEHDGEYSRLRDKGVDRAVYDGFQMWQPEGIPVG